MRPIPILVGPTGSGKTAVGLVLARRLNGEVVSADSRQVYRHLRIGTAKPKGRPAHDEKHPLKDYYSVEGVPHHLMDFWEPEKDYNAGLFAAQAGKVLESLSAAGRQPLLVGGTGLYLRALADGLAPLPSKDEKVRKELTALGEKEGRAALHAELARVDPDAAAAIPPNNLHRVVRALEVYRLTGKPISWWQKEKTTASPWPFRWFGLRWPQEEFEKMLAERCRRMLDEGLLQETKKLMDWGIPPEAPGFQALGYPLAIAYLQSRLTAEELEKRFIQETRQYVKRQMTWFRANKRIQWIDLKPPFRPDEAADLIYNKFTSL